MMTALAPIALLLLAGGLGILVAAALSQRASRRALDRRIEQISPVAQTAEPQRRRQLGARAEVWVQRIFGFGMKRMWGADVSGVLLLLSAMAGGLAAAILASALLQLKGWLVPAFFAAGFLVTPRVLLSVQQTRTEFKFLEFFPDAIDMVIRMLRAGLPVTAAIRTVGSESAAPVNGVFAELADQIEIGIPVDDALSASAKRIQLPDYRFFTVAVSMQHATGGNLAVTLEILADIIRRRRGLRLKARAVTAEVRMTAIVLACIPAFLIGALLVMDPSYLAPLVTDPRGKYIVGAALVSLSLGFLSMRQLMHSVLRI